MHGLQTALSEVHRIVTNSSLSRAVHRVVHKVDTVLDDSILLVSWLVNNASFTEVVTAATSMGAELLRRAFQRSDERLPATSANGTLLLAGRQNATLQNMTPPAEPKKSFITTIEELIHKLNYFFAALANDDPNSPANALQAAIRAGDKSTAIKIVARSSIEASTTPELGDALAALVGGDPDQARSYLGSVVVQPDAAPAVVSAAHAALTALDMDPNDARQRNHAAAVARLIAAGIAPRSVRLAHDHCAPPAAACCRFSCCLPSDAHGSRLACLRGSSSSTYDSLIAIAEVNATQWAHEEQAASQDRPSKAANVLQGIRNFVTPLVHVTSALVHSREKALDVALRSERIDNALHELTSIAADAKRRHLKHIGGSRLKTKARSTQTRSRRLSEVEREVAAERAAEDAAESSRRLQGQVTCATDARCGVAPGYTGCPAGGSAPCCSTYGWCGNTAEHCGSSGLGLKPEYSFCTAAASMPIAGPSSPTSTASSESVDALSKRSCIISAFDGLSSEILAEMIAMGTSITRLPQSIMLRDNKGDPVLLPPGIRCEPRFQTNDKFTHGCYMYLLDDAASALREATNLAGRGIGISSSYRTIIQQYVLHSWSESKSCLEMDGVSEFGVERPERSQAEYGNTFEVPVCGYWYTRKYGHSECESWTAVLEAKGFHKGGFSPWADSAQFNYFPPTTFQLLRSSSTCVDVPDDFATNYLFDLGGPVATVEECATACKEATVRCIVFIFSTTNEPGSLMKDCRTVNVNSVSSCTHPNDPRWDAYTLTGASLARQESEGGRSLRAFARLWNRHNPSDQLWHFPDWETFDEGGAMERLGRAPAAGFRSAAGRRALTGGDTCTPRSTPPTSGSLMQWGGFPASNMGPGLEYDECSAMCSLADAPRECNYCDCRGCGYCRAPSTDASGNTWSWPESGYDWESWLDLVGVSQPIGQCNAKQVPSQPGAKTSAADFCCHLRLPLLLAAAAADVALIRPLTWQLIKLREDFRACRYQDSEGAWTIGYGHNLMLGNPSRDPIVAAGADWEKIRTGTVCTLNYSPGLPADVLATCRAEGKCLTDEQIDAVFHVTYLRHVATARRNLMKEKIVNGVVKYEGGYDMDELCCPVWNAYVDMNFNMGSTHGWPKMNTAIAAADWVEAKSQMVGTNWHTQVGHRADFNMETMRRGCPKPTRFTASPTIASTITALGVEKVFEGNLVVASSLWDLQDKAAGQMPVFTTAKQADTVISQCSAARDVDVPTAGAGRRLQEADASSTPHGSYCIQEAWAEIARWESTFPAWPSGTQGISGVGHDNLEAFTRAVDYATSLLSQYGGNLTSLCCPVQSVLIDFVYSYGMGAQEDEQLFGRFWGAIAVSDWALAASKLDQSLRRKWALHFWTGKSMPRNWCRAHTARCAAHQATLRAGCAARCKYLLDGGFTPNDARDTGLAQRMDLPRWAAHNYPSSPMSAQRVGAARRWVPPPKIPKPTECLNASNAGPGKWWTETGEQKGTRALGRFVWRHFPHVLSRPYYSACKIDRTITRASAWRARAPAVGISQLPILCCVRPSAAGSDAYNCRKNTNGPGYSVHSEGRAIDFMIPTWPCGTKIIDYKTTYPWLSPAFQGHPTCSGRTRGGRGRARNDLGDQLALWLTQNSVEIGVSYLIYDRTQWNPRDGFAPYTGRHPHHDHIHVEIERDAAADADPVKYPFFDPQRQQTFAPQTPFTNILANVLQSEPSGEGAVDASEYVTIGEEIDASMAPPDGKLLSFEVSNARFVTESPSGRLFADRATWGNNDTAAATLLFDVTITLSAAIECASGSGSVQLPFKTSAAMAFIPAVPFDDEAPPAMFEPEVLPWLACSTASSLQPDATGALQVTQQRDVGAPHVLVRQGARCNMDASNGGLDDCLGFFASAARCSAACNARRDCTFFIWNSAGPGGECLMQHTSSASCPQGWESPSSFSFFQLVRAAEDSPVRWWANHEQIRLRAELVQSVMGDADGLCALRDEMMALDGASKAAAVAANEADAGFAEARFVQKHVDELDGPLLVRTRGSVDASVRAAVAVQQLSSGIAGQTSQDNAPVPIHLPSNLCEMRCSGGSVLRPRGGYVPPDPLSVLLARVVDRPNVSYVAPEAPTLTQLSGNSLPGPVVVCVDQLDSDKRDCALSKRRAEERFLFCLRHAGNQTDVGVRLVMAVWRANEGMPKAPRELVSWWLMTLRSVNLPAPAIAQLATIFDCASFAAAQAAACACVLAEAPATPLAMADTASGLGDGMAFMGGTVGLDADPRADNINFDILAVSTRLSALGYTTKTKDEFEHALRMFACASDGVARGPNQRHYPIAVLATDISCCF